MPEEAPLTGSGLTGVRRCEMRDEQAESKRIQELLHQAIEAANARGHQMMGHAAARSAHARCVRPGCDAAIVIDHPPGQPEGNPTVLLSVTHPCRGRGSP